MAIKKHVLINAISIGVGQIVVLFATPILARIYSPADFGVYAAMVATTGVVATIASLRFDSALPAVPEDDVNPLFHIAIILPLAVSIIAILLVKAFFFDFKLFSGATEVPFTLLVLTTAFVGAANVCQGYCVRNGEFTRIALVKFSQPVLFALSALFTIVGLNAAYLISWASSFLLILWGCRFAFSRVDLKRSLGAVKNARKYPVLSAPLAILDTLSLALPVFYIVSAYGPENAGNYTQVQRLIGAPLILLGLAITQVFYKYAGDLYRSGKKIEPLMWQVVSFLLCAALLLFVITYHIGPEILILLLGEGWRTDADFLFLCLAPITLRMVFSPVSSVFLISNRMGLGSIWQSIYFVSTVGCIELATQSKLKFDSYLFLLCCVELFAYILYFLLSVMVVRTACNSREH